MTRLIYYKTITGETRAYRAKKPGPKPIPAALRRERRVIASVTKAIRNRLDAEIFLLPFSESEIIEMALQDWFAKMDQERIFNGLLYSNQVNT